MNKKQNLRRKKLLNARENMGLYVFKYHAQRSHTCRNLRTKNLILTAELDKIKALEQIKEILQLHQTVKAMRTQFGAAPENGHRSLEGAFVPYLLGLTNINPMENTKLRNPLT